MQQRAFILWLLVGAVSCHQPVETDVHHPESLLRVGSVVVTEADVEHYLQTHLDGREDSQAREKAMQRLASQARFVQAALDAKLDQDPLVRAEFARILAGRYRELKKTDQMARSRANITEDRLKELYHEDISRFHSNEKRRVAVLWMDPGQDPARAKAYAEKLGKAREWFFRESDLGDHPEKGFSVLAIDHSDHAASRFKGGDMGWLEKDQSYPSWKRTVSEIAFSLDQVGDVSEVVFNSEGVFLVRATAITPAFVRPFAKVRAELEREEKTRLREESEADWMASINAAYPITHR